MIKDKKLERKSRRKKSIRKKIFGTDIKPRVSLYKSNTSLYVQVINDDKGVTLCSYRDSKSKNIESAKELGKNIAEIMKSKKIESGVFDRNGNRFHGSVKAFVDEMRNNGIKI